MTALALLRRRRRFWGLTGLLAALIVGFGDWALAHGSSSQVLWAIAFAGEVTLATACALYGWYQIKVIRLKQQLTLPQ